VGHGVWVARPHPNIMCASHLWPLLCRCLDQLHEWSKDPECENLVWGRGMIIFTYYYMPRNCQNEGRFLPILMTRKELQHATHQQKLHNTRGGGTPKVQVTKFLRDRTESNIKLMLDRCCKWALAYKYEEPAPAPAPALPPAPAQPAVRRPRVPHAPTLDWSYSYWRADPEGSSDQARRREAAARRGSGKARAGSPPPARVPPCKVGQWH
jgi:hypothetical protein